MTTQQQRDQQERTENASAVEQQIMISLERASGPAWDEVDQRMYQEAIRPLLSAVWTRRVGPTDPQVWKVVFGIRNHAGGWRPSAGEVREMVRAALGIEIAAPIEARNVVRAPQRPAIAAGPIAAEEEGPRGDWIEHLQPSGSQERDEFLCTLLTRIEIAQGGNVAIDSAIAVQEARERLQAEREAERRKYLEAIPEAHRERCLRLGGNDPHTAFQHYERGRRAKAAATLHDRWRARWAKPVNPNYQGAQL